MNRLLTISIAAMIAAGPGLAPAFAQQQAPAAHKIEQKQGEKRKPGQQKSTHQKSTRAEWKKGGKYNGTGNRVTDYRKNNLKEPPKGHRWVRDGNKFLLVTTATGIISSVVTAR